MTEPRTKFDWLIYADATFAGLSILIPIPLLDVLFEQIFRRRMPGAIGRRNGRSLPKPTIQELNRLPPGCLQSCLGWPILIILTFLKRLYRTILYFLTLKDASDNLSHYWHRAFLLDYIIRAGYVDNPATVPLAAEALRQILDEITTSPLSQLAGEIVSSVRHIFSSLRRVMRRGEEDEVVTQAKERMATIWSSYDSYFAEVATRYEARYEQLVTTEGTQWNVGEPGGTLAEEPAPNSNNQDSADAPDS
ncbi:MAG: hypothetical protein H6658_21385 [Ardenticatenaceae bacterium]|nr:hypothetical protein [Ardenticatenaceae bacterium]